MIHRLAVELQRKFIRGDTDTSLDLGTLLSFIQFQFQLPFTLISLIALVVLLLVILLSCLASHGASKSNTPMKMAQNKKFELSKRTGSGGRLSLLSMNAYDYVHHLR